jgi:hypothetical protein
MKSNTKPRLNLEAETVAAWAYRSLLQNKSEPFPYESFKVMFPPFGSGAELIPIDKPKRTAPRAKPFNGDETTKRIYTLTPKLNRVLDQFEQALARGDYSKDQNAFKFAVEVGQVIGRLNKLLLRLAELPNNPNPQAAIERLAFYSMSVANELEKLSRRNLDLLKPIARKWGSWPVDYSPHKDRKRDIEKLAKNLGIGRAAPERVWNQRANFGDNQTALGIFAIRAMQNVLREIRETSPLRGRLLAEVRGPLAGLGANSGPLTNQEKRLLVSRGWPVWILDAVDLPPITKDTARLWAKSGWAALKEAAGGDVTSIPELAAKGESNAQYARRRATTEKGKKGRQASRKETQIKKLFIKSFVSRFGGESVTPLAS